MNKMCASSCDFVKRHFFSDYLTGFLLWDLEGGSGLLRRICAMGWHRQGAAWALAGGGSCQPGARLLWAGPEAPSPPQGFRACPPTPEPVAAPSPAWPGHWGAATLRGLWLRLPQL